MAKKAQKRDRTGGMTIDRIKYGYDRTRSIGADGKVRTRVGNGDAVAIALHHALDAGHSVEKIAKANKLEVKGANPGQLRMNLGNMLRARVKRGEAMTIGAHTVKKLDQKLPMPEGVKAAEKASAERAKKQAATAKAAKPSARGKTRQSASHGKSASPQTAGAQS